MGRFLCRRGRLSWPPKFDLLDPVSNPSPGQNASFCQKRVSENHVHPRYRLPSTSAIGFAAFGTAAE
jgi:hypothetical protein